MGYSIVKQNGDANSTEYMEYIIDTTADVSSLPTDVAPGSVAATANLAHVYRLGNNKIWVEVGVE